MLQIVESWDIRRKVFYPGVWRRGQPIWSRLVRCRLSFVRVRDGGWGIRGHEVLRCDREAGHRLCDYIDIEYLWGGKEGEKRHLTQDTLEKALRIGDRVLTKRQKKLTPNKNISNRPSPSSGERGFSAFGSRRQTLSRGTALDFMRSRTPDWWHVVVDRDDDGWNKVESAALDDFERWVKWM